MKAKNKEATVAGIALTVFLVGTFLMFMYIQMPIWLNLAVFLPCLFISWLQWFVTGKTLVFTKDGCEVSFWRYKRFYAWHDLKVKRKEDYEKTIADFWGKGVFFSTKDIKRPHRLNPIIFAFFHPFESFFVCFYNKKSKWARFSGDDLCPQVDEKEFLEKMAEWGVELSQEN